CGRGLLHDGREGQRNLAARLRNAGNGERSLRERSSGEERENERGGGNAKKMHGEHIEPAIREWKSGSCTGLRRFRPRHSLLFLLSCARGAIFVPHAEERCEATRLEA